MPHRTADQPVQLTLSGAIAHITISAPPVNALSPQVRQGLLDALRQLTRKHEAQSAEVGAEIKGPQIKAPPIKGPAIRALVLSASGSTFIAGADIKEMQIGQQDPSLPSVIAALEACPVPSVAALNGAALGGGLEIALACNARIAVPKAKLGFPEVHLGIIPGAGGGERLVRVAEFQQACDFISGGKPISAAAALEMGLVEGLADPDQLIAAAEALVTDPHLPPRPIERAVMAQASDEDWQAAIKARRQASKGQVAQATAIQALRDAACMPLDQAQQANRQRYLELRESQQAKALRGLFFAEREVRKVPGLDRSAALDVDRLGLVGGGTMGVGIAAAALIAGLPVTLIERDAAACHTAETRVQSLLASADKRGLLAKAGGLEACKQRLTCSPDYKALAHMPFVIEAVFEDMAVKQAVLAQIEAEVSRETIIATNTSYLDIDTIAASAQRPERVLGLHFFAPANINKLVEVVQTKEANQTALATAFALADKLRKLPVLAQVCDGFIANRIYARYREQCDFLLEEGALPQQIDAALSEFGFKMGLYAVSDMSGLDIAWARRKRLAATRDPKQRYSAIADKLCEAGRLGQKTGKGWYRYEAGSKSPLVDPFVTSLIEAESQRLGLTRRNFSNEEIMQCVLTAMAEEAQSLLDEGIALRASDIDLALVTGFGFPRHQGGPLFWAAQQGRGSVENDKNARSQD